MAGGVTRCACGYDRVAAVTGRPRMCENMALPESPLAGRGLNFNMSLGLLLALGGIALVVAAHQGIIRNVAHPYLVATGAVAMGLLRYCRGCAQCRAD
jgi:hypothetical protein